MTLYLLQGSEKQGEHVHQQARTILQSAGETIGQEGKEGLFNEDPGDPASSVILSLVISNIS